MSYNQLIDKERLVYTQYGYYPVVKKNEIMNFANKWMQLEEILSEVTQTQRDKCCVLSSELQILSSCRNQENKNGPWGLVGSQGVIGRPDGKNRVVPIWEQGREINREERGESKTTVNVSEKVIRNHTINCLPKNTCNTHKYVYMHV